MKKETASFRRSFPILLVLLTLVLVGCFPQAEPTPTTATIPTNTPEPEPTEVILPTAIPQPLLLTNPQEGSPQTIGLTHDFTFAFNQPVNKESFGYGFSIEPAVSGEFVWQDDTTVTFSTKSPLSLGTHYTVQLTSDVYAQNEQPLTIPVTQNYVTAAPLEQTAQFPTNQEIDVDIHTPIWVSFNQPVAETGDDTPNPFTIEPVIPGSGRWANRSTYIFYPSEELVSSTTYTVSYSNIISLLGTRFEEMPSAFSFTTQSPKVISAEPEDLSVLTPEQPIILTFNQTMDPDSVLANLRLEDQANQQIIPSYVWNEDNTQLTIQGDFARGNTVLVVLNPAAKTRTGIALDESTRRTYATTPVFKFDETPGTSLDVDPSGYLELRFHSNVPLDPNQDFLSLVDISPRTPAEFSVELDTSGQTLTFSGFFVPGSFYSYSLSPDMVDLWGIPLGNVQFNRFATKAAPSAIMINQSTAPPSHLFFPLDDIQVPIETTNIRRVDMQSVPLSIEGYISLYCDYSDCLEFTNFEYTRYWYQSVYPYIVNTLIPSELTMAPRFKTLESGLYVFELDSPDLKSRDGLRYFGIASNISLMAKQIGNELVVWAIDITTMEPIPNASILIYNTSAEVIEGGNTDAYGLLTIDDLDSGTYHIVTGLPGEAGFGLNTVEFSSNASEPDSSFSGADFFFDRPTYHPGTTVNFLVYPEGILEEDLTIQLMYEYGGQTSPVDEDVLLAISGVGLQGSFQIPESLPLGSYSLELSGYNINQQISVVENRTQQAAIELNEASTGFTYGKEIKSYFSLLLSDTIPIPGQTIQWNVSLTGNGFNTSGECITDDDGLCHFSLPIGIYSDLDPKQTHQMKVSANNNIAGNKEFHVAIHPGDFDIEITPETWLGYAGDAFGVEIYTRQHNQENLPSAEMEARFVKVTFYDETSFVEGKQVVRRMTEETQIASTNFATNENGYARLTFTPPETGLYRISVHAANFSLEEWFYVDGVEPGQWLENGDTIMTITDKHNYDPGDSAQLFLPNPFAGPARVLLAIQNQKEYRTQVFNIEGATKIVDFAIKDTDAPQVRLSVIMMGEDENGRPSFRESTIDLTVNQTRKTLSIDSELTLSAEQKGLLKLNVSDANGEAVQVSYSLLVLPTKWVNTQPVSDVFKYQQANSPITSSMSMPLVDYLRTNGWIYGTTPSRDLPHIDWSIPFSEPFESTDTTFLTNLSTSINGESFIEFPFTPNEDAYFYFIVAVSEDGITGFQQGQIEMPTDTQSGSTNLTNEITANILASTGRDDVLLAIPYGLETQDWQVDLFSDELTFLKRLMLPTRIIKTQPASIVSALMSTYNTNIINVSNLPIQQYVDLLAAAQNEDGGWSFTPGQSSDINLTNYITFCLIESGASELMDQTAMEQLIAYLTNAIDAEEIEKASSRYSLQALTLSYQELSDVTAQANLLPIPEQIFLIQALSQQSDTVAFQNEILDLILPMAIYDEHGAYFPGDGSNALYHADESVTALVLLTLSQVQPSSNLISDIRGWLLYQAATTKLVTNPSGYAITMLALHRTSQYGAQTGEFGIQIVQNNDNVEELTSGEITGQGYSSVLTIDSANPVISIIHGEGNGSLYYLVSPIESSDPDALSNGIDLDLNLYPVGSACRPGFCSPEVEYRMNSDMGLIEAHLSITVFEFLDHIIIDIPTSSDFDIYLTSDVFGEFPPPMTSPLAYGWKQQVFTLNENNQNKSLYTESLLPGSYEVIFYIKPRQDGMLIIPPIEATSLFDSTIYARTSILPITITWEESNE